MSQKHNLAIRASLLVVISGCAVAAFLLLSGGDSPKSKQPSENSPTAQNAAEKKAPQPIPDPLDRQNDSKWETNLAKLQGPAKAKLAASLTSSQLELLRELEKFAILEELMKKHPDLPPESDLAQALYRSGKIQALTENPESSKLDQAMAEFKENRAVSQWIAKNRPHFPNKSWLFFDQLPRYVLLDDKSLLENFSTNLQVVSNPLDSKSRELFFKIKAAYESGVLRVMPSFYLITGVEEDDFSLFQTSKCLSDRSAEIQLNWIKLVHQHNITADRIKFEKSVKFLEKHEIVCDYQKYNLEEFKVFKNKLDFVEDATPFVFYKGSPVLNAPNRGAYRLVFEYLESF